MVLQTSMTQIEHLLQTAEAIRRDGKPEWMQVKLLIQFPLSSSNAFTIFQVTGLVHDLGKLLVFYGSEGQWDVVGVSRLCFRFRCFSDSLLQDTFGKLILFTRSPPC